MDHAQRIRTLKNIKATPNTEQLCRCCDCSPKQFVRLRQGTLLFLGLLLLLWVPLLIFSSGNPTYQVRSACTQYPFPLRDHVYGPVPTIKPDVLLTWQLPVLQYSGRLQQQQHGMPCMKQNSKCTGCYCVLNVLRHALDRLRASSPLCQVPSVHAFGVNATVLAGSPAGGEGFLERLSFPLFSSGERRSQAFLPSTIYAKSHKGSFNLPLNVWHSS